MRVAGRCPPRLGCVFSCLRITRGGISSTRLCFDVSPDHTRRHLFEGLVNRRCFTHFFSSKLVHKSRQQQLPTHPTSRFLFSTIPNRDDGDLRSVGACGATQSWTTLDQESIATLEDIDTACPADPCEDCNEFQVCLCSSQGGLSAVRVMVGCHVHVFGSHMQCLDLSCDIDYFFLECQLDLGTRIWWVLAVLLLGLLCGD